MDMYVNDPTLPNFDQEIRALQYLKDHFTRNPKKMKKMCLRMLPELPGFIRDAFINNIILGKDPIHWLEHAFAEMDQYPVLMKQFIEEGNHGMIFDKGTLYGFSLKTNPKWLSNQDGEWDPEEEQAIIDQALNAWMVKERRRSFRGRIVLFQDFGFSGITFLVDHAFTDEYWEECQKQWELEDKRQLDQELRVLLSKAGC